MVGNPMAHVSGCPKVLYSPILTLPSSSSNCLPQFPSRSQRKPARIRATSADTGHSHPPSIVKTKNPFSLILDVPQTIWKQTLRPLNDFGFSRKSIWEGGLSVCLWLRGYLIRHKFQKYQAVFEFAQACGIRTGTPVRIRGVNVGNVIHINPSLKSIEAVVEGNEGVSLDALVGIFTRLGREVEDIGIANHYSLAKRVLSAIEEARPLLSKIKALAEVRDSGLLQDVDKLTRSLTESCEELR
ncbi:hypothetical protein SO802_001734 [Lithocarpus litseifolius]|uniref:Mce/MlaD domain-containing protein n=1 Tax=Lithocarpus litseifolius TaxID=425828 RepID=A0AAW2DZH2_9ROSI